MYESQLRSSAYFYYFNVSVVLKMKRDSQLKNNAQLYC